MRIPCCCRFRECIKYSLFLIIINICFILYIQLAKLNRPYLSPIPDEKDLLLLKQLSLGSSLTYEMKLTKFYPHLPIQMYTNNYEKFSELKNKTKKVMLISNTFVGMRTWDIESLKNGTNSGNMSELFCPFLNNYCELTNDMSRFEEADAVVYHMIDHVDRSDKLMKRRHSSQRFVFTLWEPPINTGYFSSHKNFFNWTMTYRFDSHIYASYYADDPYRSKDDPWIENLFSQYLPNKEILVQYENINTSKKNGTVAALISNCRAESKERWSLITELRKYVDVTVYGACGKPCPTSSTDCRTYIGENYYFVLSFENSFCQDYITEKFFRMIQRPIVPVVFGQINYTRYIPQSGFIDVRQFSSMSELANRLIQIRNNLTLYQEYFQWKKDFTWNPFSEFMTPFCDLCLRLHLDTTPNIIEDVNKWWYDKKCGSVINKYL